MDIEINNKVMSSDGEEIGTVDRLIIDQESMKVREFVIQQGAIFGSDKIVDIEHIANIDGDGTIHLSITKDQAEDLTEFVESRYIQPNPGDFDLMPQTWAAGGAGGGPLFWGPAGPGRGYPGEGSMFEPAPSDPPDMEPASSVDQTAAVIAEGTEVIARDGESLGTIEEVHYDASGRITHLTVERGWISSDKLTISADLIDATGPEGIKLSTTVAEAEASGTSK
jgi:uncharacterized protein YrrD